MRQVAEWLRERLESEGAVIVSTPSAANKLLKDNSRWPIGFRLSFWHIRVFQFSALVVVSHFFSWLVLFGALLRFCDSVSRRRSGCNACEYDPPQAVDPKWGLLVKAPRSDEVIPDHRDEVYDQP